MTPWHHHGNYATIAYVAAGLKRLEFGEDGSEAVEGAPGDFLHIPPGVVHRESNPTEEQTETIAFRIGSGPTTIGADGPSDGVPIRRIAPADRAQGDPTSGMVREEVAVGEGYWSGFVRTAPTAVSGWHHHGDNHTSIYLLAGAMTIESGPGGRDAVELTPGDFCHIPPGIVHRESNPSEEESQAVVVRAGTGPSTINVDGPEEEI